MKSWKFILVCAVILAALVVADRAIGRAGRGFWAEVPAPVNPPGAGDILTLGGTDPPLPDVDGMVRAQSGETLNVRAHGDYRRTALDLWPTAGKPPQLDALSEITAHGLDGEMVSLGAFAQRDMPFGLVLETTGPLVPFVFSNGNTREGGVAMIMRPDHAMQFGDAGIVMVSASGRAFRLTITEAGAFTATPCEAVHVTRRGMQPALDTRQPPL